jgi:hypothetical protein
LDDVLQRIRFGDICGADAERRIATLLNRDGDL